MSLLFAAAFSGAALFAQVLQTYASRPKAPFVAYSIRREQQTSDGLPDFEWTYTYRVWYRASDGTALERRVFRGRPQGMEFARVSFNGPWDPGPPNADIFGLAGAPTYANAAAEPAGTLRTIAAVRAKSGAAYDVTSADVENGQWHLRLRPLHVPGTYILREVWADAGTLELKKAVVADKLFILAGPVYDQLDTMTFALLDGRETIVHVHTRANFDTQPGGDGLDVDYEFSDVTFPSTLPAWYFDPKSYGAHNFDAPA